MKPPAVLRHPLAGQYFFHGLCVQITDLVIIVVILATDDAFSCGSYVKPLNRARSGLFAPAQPVALSFRALTDWEIARGFERA